MLKGSGQHMGCSHSSGGVTGKLKPQISELGTRSPRACTLSTRACTLILLPTSCWGLCSNTAGLPWHVNIVTAAQGQTSPLAVPGSSFPQWLLCSTIELGSAGIKQLWGRSSGLRLTEAVQSCLVVAVSATGDSLALCSASCNLLH